MAAAKSSLRISVLIPTWKRVDSLARGLDALEAQTRPPEELVLAVRADDDGTRELLEARTLPFEVRIATPARAGVIAAMNAGFDLASGDVVANTDDDTVPHPDWLARIEVRFAEDPRLGALGGADRLIGHGHPPDGVEGIAVGRVEWFGRVVGNHHLGAGPIRDVDVIKGANLAVRAVALGDRRLDPALRGRGAEHHWELDLCLGLRRAGWRLAYDPAILVDHYEEIRHGGGQRETRMTDAEHADAIHNQTYALLANLPPARALAAFLYGLLVGSRDNPGLLLALERRTGRREADASATTLRVATAARLSGLRTWLRRR